MLRRLERREAEPLGGSSDHPEELWFGGGSAGCIPRRPPRGSRRADAQPALRSRVPSHAGASRRMLQRTRSRLSVCSGQAA